MSTVVPVYVCSYWALALLLTSEIFLIEIGFSGYFNWLWSWNFLSFFIEFIGATLVNKIIQVSGAQFYNTSSVHCVVCSPPKVKSLSSTIHPPYSLLYLLPPAFTTVLAKFFLFCSIPPPPTSQSLTPTTVSLFCMYKSVIILLFTSFWLWNSLIYDSGAVICENC